MKDKSNRIVNIKLTPIPLSRNINSDRFGLKIKFIFFDKQKQTKEYTSREPELSFFQDLNKIFFKYEARNIQDLVDKFSKKDVYNVFQYIFDNNFLYDENKNATILNLKKKPKEVILPIQQRYLQKIQQLIKSYIPSNKHQEVDGLFTNHLKTYYLPNHK